MPTFLRGLTMPRPLPVPIRQAMFRLWQQGQATRQIATTLGLPSSVSNSQRRYHFVSDAGTKLKYAGFNEAVPIGIDSDIFSRIGLTTCLSDP